MWAIANNHFEKLEVERGDYNRVNVHGYSRAYVDLEDMERGLSNRITFVTLTSDGEKEQGLPYKGYYATREIAEDRLDEAIRIFIADKEGAIHWRQPKQPFSHSFFQPDFADSTGRLMLLPKVMWVASCRIAVHPFIP